MQLYLQFIVWAQVNTEVLMLQNNGISCFLNGKRERTLFRMTVFNSVHQISWC